MWRPSKRLSAETVQWLLDEDRSCRRWAPYTCVSDTDGVVQSDRCVSLKQVELAFSLSHGSVREIVHERLGRRSVQQMGSETSAWPKGARQNGCALADFRPYEADGDQTFCRTSSLTLRCGIATAVWRRRWNPRHGSIPLSLQRSYIQLWAPERRWCESFGTFTGLLLIWRRLMRRWSWLPRGQRCDTLRKHLDVGGLACLPEVCCYCTIMLDRTLLTPLQPCWT
jgi:hypothetical protein